MIRRLVLAVALAGFAAVTASAKAPGRKISIFQPKVPETETLASGGAEFVYDYKWCADTTARGTDSEDGDLMLLQTGPGGLSKFSSLRNLRVDSMIMRSSHEQIVDAAIDGKLSTGEPMTIFKNYPAGRLTHIEKVCMDYLRYDEEMPRQDWELTDTSTTVLGHECLGARTVYGGREWTAFFAVDIPLPEGPWKLCGLPGLIMKASDSEGDYRFECTGIKVKSDRPVTIYKVPYNDTDRHGFYDTRHRYDVNPYAYFESTGCGTITVSDDDGNPVVDAFDPMELKYDYIERDWRKQ